MSIDKKAFGITEVHTPVDLDESMVSRYATQVVLGSKLKEMLDGDNTELNTLTLTEDPDDAQSEEPTTEDTIVEDTTTDNTTEEPVIEEPVIEEPVAEDTPSTDQENTQSNDQEEITVDEETV